MSNSWKNVYWVSLYIFLSLVELFLPAIRLRRSLVDSLVLFNGAAGSIINCTYDKKDGRYTTNLLTCKHVVRDETVTVVKFLSFDWNGHYQIEEILIGKVIRQNDYLDFAIVQVKTRRWYRAVIPNYANVRLLDKVYTVGAPKNRFWITEGSISSLNTEYGYFGCNSNIYPGNSGGPCFNARGEQIGIAARVAAHMGIWDMSYIHHMAVMVDLRSVKLVLGKDYYRYFKGF